MSVSFALYFQCGKNKIRAKLVCIFIDTNLKVHDVSINTYTYIYAKTILITSLPREMENKNRLNL